MQTENIYDAYRKGVRVIESCERPGHLMAARKYIARVNKLDKLLGRKREIINYNISGLHGSGFEPYGFGGVRVSFEVGQLLYAYRNKEVEMSKRFKSK